MIKRFLKRVPKIIFLSGSQRDKSLTKVNDKIGNYLKKKSIDSFIDELVEYQETYISSKNNFISAQKVLQREFESQNLSPTELRRFNGDPDQWPEFI